MAKKIKIEGDLYEKLEKRAREEGYSCAEEFVMHILEKAVHGGESDETAEKVKEKLRGLGYLS